MEAAHYYKLPDLTYSSPSGTSGSASMGGGRRRRRIGMRARGEGKVASNVVIDAGYSNKIGEGEGKRRRRRSIRGGSLRSFLESRFGSGRLPSGYSNGMGCDRRRMQGGSAFTDFFTQTIPNAAKKVYSNVIKPVGNFVKDQHLLSSAAGLLGSLVPHPAGKLAGIAAAAGLRHAGLGRKRRVGRPRGSGEGKKRMQGGSLDSIHKAVKAQRLLSRAANLVEHPKAKNIAQAAHILGYGKKRRRPKGRGMAAPKYSTKLSIHPNSQVGSYIPMVAMGKRKRVSRGRGPVTQGILKRTKVISRALKAIGSPGSAFHRAADHFDKHGYGKYARPKMGGGGVPKSHLMAF